MEKSIYNEFGLGIMFKWMDCHNKATKVILVLEALAAFWAVLTYNFTTHI